MLERSPKPLSAAQFRTRQTRVARVAKAMGFVGKVEYRHVHSQTGGAQYGRSSREELDLLSVFAEAFERDADPEDFSLEAIIAHECGHQVLIRHPRLSKRVAGISQGSEEILASLVGASICRSKMDRDTLFAKAAAELLDRGQSVESAVRLLRDLQGLLEALL